ncbi:hypothetical protein CLD22_02870 [Rubrivivax gelatinosus]|nr:hypothetical protein [Rubrivivax gelatinosus]
MTTSPKPGASPQAAKEIDPVLLERAAYAMLWALDSTEQCAAAGPLLPQGSREPADYRTYADKLGQHANTLHETARRSRALAWFLGDPPGRLDRLDMSLRAELEQKARDLGSKPWSGIPLSAFPDPDDVE